MRGRRAWTAWTGRDILHLVPSVERRQGLRGQGRTAIVVSGPADYGMARMYQILADEGLSRVGVFQDAGEADRWVKV